MHEEIYANNKAAFAWDKCHACPKDCREYRQHMHLFNEATPRPGCRTFIYMLYTCDTAQSLESGLDMTRQRSGERRAGPQGKAHWRCRAVLRQPGALPDGLLLQD